MDRIPLTTAVIFCNSSILDNKPNSLFWGTQSEQDRYCPPERSFGGFDGESDIWDVTSGAAGFAVGAGTPVSVVMLCAHYHDANEGSSTSETSISLSLEPEVKHPTTKAAEMTSRLMYATMQPVDGAIMTDHLPVPKPGDIHLARVDVHGHSHGMRLKWIQILLGNQTLLNEPVHEVTNTGFVLPSPGIDQTPNRDLTLACTFDRDQIGKHMPRYFISILLKTTMSNSNS